MVGALALAVTVALSWAGSPPEAAAQSNYSPVPEQAAEEDSESAGKANSEENDEDSDSAGAQHAEYDAEESGADDRGDSSETGAEQGSSKEDDRPMPADPRAYCDRFMEPYVRSSSRKLYRALVGHDFDLEELQLQDWVTTQVETRSGQKKKVEFEVFREKEGRVAGLVDTERDYRRTLVVAMTDSGPIIASQKWRPSDEIDVKADCKPVGSRVEYPLVTLDEIDIEPFKFWGMRVLWRLPPSFSKGQQDRKNLYDTIVEVMSVERAAADAE